MAGPFSFEMSHDQTSLGHSASSSGRASAEWVSWSRRSRTRPWRAASSRYIVRCEARKRPSSSRVVQTCAGRGWPHRGLVLIGGGFWLIATAWRYLHAAQRAGVLAVDGPYARIRHPQYAGLLLIMIGFLLQWPTLETLVMFPVLVWVYRCLAIREERDVRSAFGAASEQYAGGVPRFMPRRARGHQAKVKPLGDRRPGAARAPSCRAAGRRGTARRLHRRFKTWLAPAIVHRSAQAEPAHRGSRGSNCR